MPKVEVLPYHEGWSDDFESVRRELDRALGPAVKAIHHIGSTSVPLLSAKPVIDTLVETPSLTMIDDSSGMLEALGYEARGEYGIPGRRYFSRPKGKGPKVHVHAFASGSSHLERHLRFRDFLRRHPDEAAEYSAVKQDLAARFANDPRSYQEGKAEIIRDIEVRALAFATRTVKPRYWSDRSTDPEDLSRHTGLGQTVVRRRHTRSRPAAFRRRSPAPPGRSRPAP